MNLYHGQKIGRFSNIIDRNYPFQHSLNIFLSSSADQVSSASNSTWTSISSQLDNKEITTNQNKNNNSNTDDIHSCVTTKK